MELRDYLMPGEYILGIMQKLDINNGKFHNIAVTNKRFILFNTKKRGFLKKVQEITKMESLSFENSCGIRVEWRKKGLKTQWIILYVCARIYPRSSQKVGCTSAGSVMITGSSIGGTSPDEVLNMLTNIFNSLFNSLVTEKVVWDERINKEESNYNAVYIFKNCEKT